MSFVSECTDNFKEIVTQKYCLFSGRARRREFWEYQLAVWVISIILTLIERALHLQIVSGNATVGILSGIAGLALLLPGLGVTVRRLHDIDKDWYWIFIVCIPCIGSIWLLVLECMEGNRFDNRFGPDPKAERLLDTDPGDLPGRL